MTGANLGFFRHADYPLTLRTYNTQPALVAGFFMRGRMVGMGLESLYLLFLGAVLFTVVMSLPVLLEDVVVKRLQFSLHNLLIATMLVSMVLGLIVYAVT